MGRYEQARRLLRGELAGEPVCDARLARWAGTCRPARADVIRAAVPDGPRRLAERNRIGALAISKNLVLLIDSIAKHR